MFQFLKNTRFIHAFYFVILLIMSYLLYFIYPSKRECLQAESSAKSLENSFHIADAHSGQIKSEIDEQTKAYANAANQFNQNTANISISKCNLLIEMIHKVQKELKADFKQDSGFINHKYSTITPRKILKTNKISEIKQALESYEDTSFVNRFEPTVWQQLKIHIGKYRNQILWDKINQLSYVSAIAQLEAMKVAAAQTNILILNYLKNTLKGEDLVFDKFGININTENHNVKVGEPIEAYISLYKYASKLDTNYTITCNGKPLVINEGIAHYEKTFNRPGKHTLIAQGTYRNPFTRQTETSKREFNIEVLPK